MYNIEATTILIIQSFNFVYSGSLRNDQARNHEKKHALSQGIAPFVGYKFVEENVLYLKLYLNNMFR